MDSLVEYDTLNIAKSMNITLVSAAYNFSSIHSKSLNIDEMIQRMDELMKLPVPLIFFCDDLLYNHILNARFQNGLGGLTIVVNCPFEKLWSAQWLQKVKENREIYFPTRDERTCAETHLITCNKFDFVLKAMDLNPFCTAKFGWLDAFVTRDGNPMRFAQNYKRDEFLHLLRSVSEDKFHISVLNVNDKKYMHDEWKREYYETYRYVVCGCLFTCGERVGRIILNDLKANFVRTTEMGYGHGEEMLYLEILEKHYDLIHRGYGDYHFLINNFLIPTYDLHYVYYMVIQRYMGFRYIKECYHCCELVLIGIEKGASCTPDLHADILDIFHECCLLYRPKGVLGLRKHIEHLCSVEGGDLLKSVLVEKHAHLLDSDFYIEPTSVCEDLELDKLVVLVVNGGDTKECRKSYETWAKKGADYGVRVLFMGDRAAMDYMEDEYVLDLGIADSDPFLKQNRGLKYAYDVLKTEFVYVCNAKTFVNFHNLMDFVGTLEYGKYVYAGGHGTERRISGVDVYFHSGGPGYILSRSCLRTLMPFFDSMKDKWLSFCDSDLVEGRDVCLAFYLNQVIGVDVLTVVKSPHFYNCNHHGYCYGNSFQCCGGKVVQKEIIGCHHMSPNDMDEYMVFSESFYKYKKLKCLDA